jgi:hypothetical protein
VGTGLRAQTGGGYTAGVNGSGCFNDGGQSSSSGVFVNGTPQTTLQDSGFANGGALSGFNFTLAIARWTQIKPRRGHLHLMEPLSRPVPLLQNAS